MRSVKAIFIALICIGLLAACGLRGPLYLPDDEPADKSANEQQANKEKKETKNRKDTEKDTTQAPFSS